MELVGGHYGLEVTGCELFRSLVNDVYEIDAGADRFAFKLYQQSSAERARSADEVAWEQELVRELRRTGFGAPRPVALLNGDSVGQLSAPEGPRPFALTEWVEGGKPSPPWSGDLYRDFGSLIARFHSAAEWFTSERNRRPIDPPAALNQAVEEVVLRLPRVEDQRLVAARAGLATRQLGSLAEADMTWGVRHGDVTLDNVHRVGGDLVLHDFDRSGPGWLAADLTGVRATVHWPAFLDGYLGLRSLSSADLAALPWLRIADLISNLRFHLVDKSLIRGVESRSEGWVERELASLRDTPAPGDLAP